MMDLSNILGIIGYIFFGVFLLGAFLIFFFVFVKDREQKPKDAKAAKDGLFDKAGRKNKRALVAKSKKITKDEAAEAVFASKPSGFSFGGSQPAAPAAGMEFAPAAQEPAAGMPVKRRLPDAPDDGVPSGGAVRSLRKFPPPTR